MRSGCPAERYPPSGAFFSQSVIAPATNISTAQPPAGVKLFDADEVVRAAQSYLHDSGHTSAQSPILLSKLGLQQVVKKSMVGANDAGLSLSQILRSKHDIFGFCGQAETTAVFLIENHFTHSKLIQACCVWIGLLITRMRGSLAASNVPAVVSSTSGVCFFVLFLLTSI
jgi:hypothetical protein